MRRPSLLRVLIALAMLAGALSATSPASASPLPEGCDIEATDTIDGVLACVDARPALFHLRELQKIAKRNGNVRSAGSAGYDQSVDYVVSRLERAGIAVERQAFEVDNYQEISVELAIDGAPVEVQTATFSGSGAIADANVIPVDLDLGLGNASSSGCEPEDFDGLDFSGDSDVALIQRGACSFFQKADNAATAGAEAVILFNQGNTEDRRDIINSTLGGVGVTIPVLDVAYFDGVALSETTGVVSLSAETISETVTTENVIAEVPGVNQDNVVMAGAHLDSVTEGPGIQDNGSGSAALLAIALGARELSEPPQNTLRFAWWGAEELGLVGSFEYFTNADFGLLNTPEEIDKIAAYLNFDMIASPNFIYGVYDADESTFEASAPVPEGSEAIEDLFEAYYSANDIPYEDTEFSGRSDYQVFLQLDIPAGGLFTGAEQIKSAEQVAIWGGTADEQYDQCYHEACDTYLNVSAEALEVNIKAISYALFFLGASTESVNGVPGVEVEGPTPDDVEIDGPQGTFLNGGGGFSLDKLHDAE